MRKIPMPTNSDKYAKELQRRTIEGVIRSFMTRKRSKNWVMGVIKGRSLIRGDTLRKLFDERIYSTGDKSRLRELKQECERQELL